MYLGRLSTRYRASIDALLVVLLATVLGLPTHGYGQEVTLSNEAGLKYVSQQTESPEQSRRQRLDRLRRCQVCARDGVGFKFNIPIFVPLAAFRAAGDGDQDDDGAEEGTPQLVDSKTRLRFGFEGYLTFRIRNVTIEAHAIGVSLGNNAVLNLEDTSQALGSLDLWTVAGGLILQWNTRLLSFGKAARPSYLALWPYAGGRFSVLSARAEAASERLMLSQTLFWGEPLVGIEVILDPPTGWSFVIDANVGGFTVGADVSTHVQARAVYHFTSWFAVRMGWALIYARGRPDNRLIDEFELFLQGPIIGFQFSTP